MEKILSNNLLKHLFSVTPLSNLLQNGQKKKKKFSDGNGNARFENLKLTYISSQLTLISFLTQHLVTLTTVKKVYSIFRL